MDMITMILAGAGAIAILLIAFLTIVIVGIRACERHMNLTGCPITPTERVARRVLGTLPARRR
jgi:hypothetical protein